MGVSGVSAPAKPYRLGGRIMTPHNPSIPVGLCQCGCGQTIRLCSKSSSSRGWVKGEPLKFIHGHAARLNRIPSEGVYPNQKRHYDKLNKAGLCVNCGKYPQGHTVMCENCRRKDRIRRGYPGDPKTSTCSQCGCDLPIKSKSKYCESCSTLACEECGTRFYFRGRGTRTLARYCSQHCSASAQTGLRGEFARNWKGGRVAEKLLIRGRIEYLEWRRSVFARDNYTCQDCGIRSGNGHAVVLHAHHIKEFSSHPELRTTLSNGLTLCKMCHRKRHTKYGRYRYQNVAEDVFVKITNPKQPYPNNIFTRLVKNHPELYPYTKVG